MARCSTMDETTPTSPDPDDPTAPVRTRGAWALFWRCWYRLLRVLERPLKWVVARYGLGNLVLLRVPGRRSGRVRSVPLGLLTVRDRLYLGHPSGDTGWTLNLRACDRASLVRAGQAETPVRVSVVPRGPERDAVVRASFVQHPFPGNALYRLAGRHVAAHAVFFRLEEVGPVPRAQARSTNVV